MAYFFAFVLLLLNFGAWIGTLFLAPGNWMIVSFAALYAWLLPDEYAPRLSWTVVSIAFALAILGEALEFAAGAAGARRVGGSRKGAIYAIVGAFAGSVGGAMIGIPIPIVGSVIAAVAGGALGAYLGAYIAENHLEHEQRVRIGQGALWGRLWGTAGKLSVGVVMVVIITLDSFFDLPVDAMGESRLLEPVHVLRLLVSATR